MHLHLVDLLSRNGRPRLPYERGPKDTVHVGDTEIIWLLVTFDSPSLRGGRYLVHCHNLPHEATT